ncbi:hypothetical protein N7462_001695 [Penicillium macrosclerotiorum]|uniref:uncharacterized protein n=1 Tax=Penicillium macrosclerotiorum TaxID=303699 RepID=UPI00254825C9|nr:uncharacterized protein N7462_001695 [Penicillium macrosclerotiorum]KAJ5692272.1 hypothetical protein N7462_001695 [Penicillium macrosclerotiorum]
MEDSKRLERVSSLYGAGTTGCWLLTTLSVFITWTLNIRSRSKDTITNDFIATVSLPAVAAGHLIYEISNSPWPVTQLLTSKEEQIDQASAAVEAPLTICETYIAFALVFAAIASRNGHHRRFLVVLIVGLLSFSTEILLFAQSANTRISTLNFVRPFIFNFAWGMALAFVFLIFTAIVFLVCMFGFPLPPGQSAEDPMVREYKAELRAMMASGLVTMLSLPVLLLASLSSATGIFGATDYGASISNLPTKAFFFIPKSSSSITDLDQAFALAAGLLTLVFSLRAAYKSRRDEEERKFELWKARREVQREEYERWATKLKEAADRLKYASQLGEVDFAEGLEARIMDQMARLNRDGFPISWPS